MPRQAIVSAAPSDDDRRRDAALRPKWLREVIGQQAIVKKLKIAVNAAKKLKDPLGHILFDGPPGLGKTTFATVLPHEMGTTIQMTSGPALAKPADLLPFLTNLEEGSILFIDEIHRMPRVVEEFIYPAMEDFRIDIVLGDGMSARTISMPLKRFTLIGATTRSGMLSSPMRDRFRMHEHLEFYSVEELATIVQVNAHKLATPMNIPSDTLSDEVEPYLLREQYIIRTPRGRMARPRAYELLGKTPRPPEDDPQMRLFG